MDKPCFELKGSLFTLTVLQLFEDDLSLLETQLKERIKMAPGFFNHTPLVIDLHELAEDKQHFDFFDFRELLLSLSIIPVGVKGAAKSVHTLLEAAGMAVLAETKTQRSKKTDSSQSEEVASQSESGLQQELIQEPQPTPEKPEAESAIEEPTSQQTKPEQGISYKPTKMIKQTIRSGQQIYAPGGDLIVIGSVSAGAEILADGNIHIYGTLRGRALAGVRGDQSAAIFCHSLQSELISVAGIYLLSDDIPENKIGAAVQISLTEEKLQIKAFN